MLYLWQFSPGYILQLDHSLGLEAQGVSAPAFTVPALVAHNAAQSNLAQAQMRCAFSHEAVVIDAQFLFL